MGSPAVKALEVLSTLDASQALPREFLLPAAKAQQETMRHWGNLNAILMRHEATIRSRWKKKTKGKRQEILRSVYKEIPERHRPEVVTDGEEREGTNTIELHHLAQLVPYYNAEDLCDPNTFPIFLNARGRHHPAVFAAAETDFATGSCIKPEVDEKFKKFKMYIGERDDILCVGTEYGTISECALEHADYLANETPRCGPCKGLTTLALQSFIYGTLVEICIILLTNNTVESVWGDPVLLEPPPLLDHTDATSLLTEAARLMPYRVRLKPDFARLRYLTSTSLEVAKEHIRALREDPSYFAENIQTHMEHRLEHISDEHGEPAPMSKMALTEVISDIIVFSNTSLTIWTKVHEDLILLETLASGVEGKVGQVLPKEYASMTKLVYYFLRFQQSQMTQLMRRRLWGSPPLRHLHLRGPGDDPEYFSHDTDDYVGDHLVNVLHRLGERAQDPCDTLFRFDYLDTYQKSEPAVRQKISPLIEQFLTPIAICTQCLVELRIAACNTTIKEYFRWLDDNDPEEEWGLPFQGTIRSWVGMGLDDMDTIVPKNLGNPADGKFDYPEEDTQSKATIDARCKAERNLDRFWVYVDNACRKKRGTSQHETVQRFFKESGPMQRTAPWRGETSRPAKDTSSHEYHPLSEVYHDASKDITGNFDRLALGGSSKGKEKTRGTAAPADDAAGQQPAPAEVAERPVFHVDKNSMVIFRMLFPMEQEGELRRSTRWADVVSALTRLGFSAQKLHGSAWQFTPREMLRLDRGIQFHEPHPEGVVSLQLARRLGRRLTRAYGWDGSMFRRR